MAELVKLMNMCMVTDQSGRVLVQSRCKDDWAGNTFPGGKVEPGEALTRAVIREVYEETGLTISHPKICGAKEWKDPDGTRQLVLFYKADSFTGEIHDSPEGKVQWMTLAELLSGPMADGMDDMLRVFMEDDLAEIWYEYLEHDTWEKIIL